MNKNTLTIAGTALLSILVLFISWSFSGELFELLLPEMEHVRYQVTAVSGTFWAELFIPVLFGLLPIIIVLVWRAAKVTTPGKKIAVASTIIGCGLLSLFLRHIILVIQFSNFHSLFPGVNLNYPINDVNFGGFLLGGLMVGCIVTVFVFRDMRATGTMPR